MPGFDQRGPSGQGPMTGRRMGRCTNFGAGRKSESAQGNQYDNPENIPSGGFGFGKGRFMGGRGMGWRHRFRAI